MFIVRQSEHINEDLERNWSSWNYGLEGLSCTEDQIEEWKQQSIDNDMPFCVSGFELWGEDIESADIRELYENYWVLVDLNRGEGLSCNTLECDTIEQAISIVTNEGFKMELGEGETIDCSNAKIVWSDKDNFIHIIEIK